MAESYHLLSTCAAPPTGGARVAFARSVRTAVDGFVEHEAYVAAAQRSSVCATGLATWAPLDVNPVVELLRCAPERAAVVSRFNAFNDAAPLGVVSRLDGSRLERSSGDERSAAIMALAFGWLTRNRAPDEPRRLLTLQDNLGGSADAVRDVLTRLYDTPWASVDDVVEALGAAVVRCSARSRPSR
ncbi:hypothetical protein [Nocardia jiangsuensis]|uniref:Uncharacterized protein n=1 Tax=Nocardia jiangsuensis TaxID=1691563 RepID=A0ABV8DLJ8_9NOCA